MGRLREVEAGKGYGGRGREGWAAQLNPGMGSTEWPLKGGQEWTVKHLCSIVMCL